MQYADTDSQGVSEEVTGRALREYGRGDLRLGDDERAALAAPYQPHAVRGFQ